MEELMPFFEYQQNNSGGVWDGDFIRVIVEANGPSEADALAQEHGVYFDGVAHGRDCECCGDRWSSAWGDGDPVPSVYGKPIEEWNAGGDRDWGLKTRVVRADGTTTDYPLTA
jgi:hypothetical protein